MADIVLKQPGTVQNAARLHAPPRVVVDIARRNDGEVQKESERAQGQGTVAAAPRATDETPKERAVASSPPPVASSTVPTLPLPPVLTLTSAQLLEQAEKQWAARQLEAAQRSYTAFLQRYPEHSNNHLIAARVADILRAQEHYRAALEAYVVVEQGYPGSEGALISQIRMAELGTTSPDLLPTGDEPRYAAYRHPLETLRRLTSDYPFNPLADVARFKLAEILLQQQDIAAALDLLQQLLRRPLQDALRRDVEQQLRQALGRQLEATNARARSSMYSVPSLPINPLSPPRRQDIPISYTPWSQAMFGLACWTKRKACCRPCLTRLPRPSSVPI